MMTREDEFRLYNLYYQSWFGNSTSIEFVNGNFLSNIRNIIYVFSIQDLEEITESTKAYFSESRDDNKPIVIIEKAKYILEGAEIKGTKQYIHCSEYVKENDVPSYLRKKICLVAYRKDKHMHKEPSIRDYYYKYELCADAELTLTEQADTQRYCFNVKSRSRGIRTLTCLPNKKHAFKSSIDLPYNALPHTPNSNENSASFKIPSHNLFNWKMATGIGIAGAGNEKLRCIDIDGCQCEEFVINFLETLGLPPNYPWTIRTGSGEGYHIWIWCESLPTHLLLCGDSKSDFEKSSVLYFKSKGLLQKTFNTLEIRWNAFCMLPPSIGPSGNKYEFMFGIPSHGMTKVDGKELLTNVTAIAENTTVDYAHIVHHDTQMYSDDEQVQTLFMCFDTETTGLPLDYNESYKDTKNWPRIVQISYVIFEVEHGKIYTKEKKDFILAPKRFKIPKESTKVHGITQEKAMKDGYNRKHVLEYIAEQLQQVDYLVGHNVSFDINVLRSEFEREGIDVNSSFNHIQTICTMKAGVKLYPPRSKWPKLETLYKDLIEEDMEGAHNALNDVNATIKCFLKLYEKGIIDVKERITARELDLKSSDWE